jgi:anaerobic selenocysteine-containing dehydrogenase
VETVVVFEQFMTDTAELADYVLPVTTFLEETDVVASYWHNMIGPVNPVIKPQGEARSDLRIYQELAERLDIADGMRGTPDEWLERIIKPLTLQGLSLERIKNKHRRAPFAETIAFEDANFKTEDRKLHLINSFEAQDFTTRKYPFRLLTVHARNSIHSQITDSDENGQEIEAIVNPRTAKSSRLEERERARLVSPAGEINVVVRFDLRMKEDVVAIKQGEWLKRGKSVNQLTSVSISNAGESACYYQTPVRLERL